MWEYKVLRVLTDVLIIKANVMFYYVAKNNKYPPNSSQ